MGLRNRQWWLEEAPLRSILMWLAETEAGCRAVAPRWREEWQEALNLTEIEWATKADQTRLSPMAHRIYLLAGCTEKEFYGVISDGDTSEEEETDSP